MDLGLGLFYYTLIVLLAVILTAATCLASYLVTRNKTYRYAFAGFLFYFFDVALVFQDDFLMQRASDASASPFFIGSPVASVLVGGGALISFWLVLCEYLEEDRPAVRWIYDADPSDNSVQCIVKMTSFIGGDSFIGKIMHVELGDLATGEMTAGGKTTLPSLQTVIEGSWDMSFPLNYEDASIELSAGQRTKLDGIDVAIDSVVLSPIAIVVEYTADEPLMTKDEETGKRRGSAGIDVPITVNLRNGSSIDVPSVGAMNDGGATKRRADLMFDKILDLTQVKSVTVGGVEIPMP